MDKRIPVVVPNDLSETRKILSALRKYGIFCAEITFRTPCAEDAIKLAVEEFPDMTIGAGTVIDGEQCKRAVSAGAKIHRFPGTFGKGRKRLQKKAYSVLSRLRDSYGDYECVGVGNHDGEIFSFRRLRRLKAMKALAAPFPQIRFIPTGGVDKNNLQEYLAWDRIYAVGGSAFVKEALENDEK